jgi:hypothetical protein
MSSAKARTFDPQAFLAQTGLGRTILQYPKNKVIFALLELERAAMTGRISDARTEIEARLQELESRKSPALSCNRNPSFLQLSCFEQLFEIAIYDTTVKERRDHRSTT